MAHISVDLPEDLLEKLRRAAGEMQSSPEALLAQAAREMLADRDALAEAIAEGEADLAHGREASHEEVMQEMRDWSVALRLRKGMR